MTEAEAQSRAPRRDEPVGDVNSLIERIRNEDDSALGHFIDQKYYFQKSPGEWWTYYAGFSLTKFAKRILALAHPAASQGEAVPCRWPACEDDTDCMNGCKPAPERPAAQPMREAALETVYKFMDRDNETGESDLWTDEYADLFETVKAALAPASANEKSQAKEPEASGGLCTDAPHAVRVGESGADQTATSEHMDVTAGETAPSPDPELDLISRMLPGGAYTRDFVEGFNYACDRADTILTSLAHRRTPAGTRNEIIEECAIAAEAQDRTGHEWVHDSLWANILKRAGANVRRLKSEKPSNQEGGK